MSAPESSRRDFLKNSMAAAAAGSMPYWFSPVSARAAAFDQPSERPVAGCIGTGSRWGGLAHRIARYADCVAVCDVDANHAGTAKEKVTSLQQSKGRTSQVDVYDDYRRILDRDDIDIVSIVTPDHWHTKIAIEAMRAGKDVYCEKPLTLTIDEGKQIIKTVDETKRVFQVGTQQRSEMGQRFLQAIALIRDGRIGDVKHVTCVIGGAPLGGRFRKEAAPEHLNWDMWLGPAPQVAYMEKRCHYEFRWWYEYSGGKMTDWGAHHVDIAQWGIGMDQSGPTSVDGTSQHPCRLERGYPTVDDIYNTAYQFDITCRFPNGVEMLITDHDEKNNIDNGILFEGTKGRFFVRRSKIVGKPIEDLEHNPLPDDALVKVYRGKEPGDHMGNFMECVKTRELPISDVYTHHRAMTTCHLANIAIRLGRKITWDPQTETIVGDREAAAWTSREPRRGYEIEA